MQLVWTATNDRFNLKQKKAKKPKCNCKNEQTFVALFRLHIAKDKTLRVLCDHFGFPAYLSLSIAFPRLSIQKTD
jgi:hypothetical protein